MTRFSHLLANHVRLRLPLVGLALVAVSIACRSDSTAPSTIRPSSELYWSLGVNRHVVTLSTRSPYDTLQLNVAPQTVHGVALPGGEPQFRVGDGSDTSVVVSSTGLVTAHSITSGTRILISMTYQGMTLQDTVLVRVDTTAPVSPTHPLQTFSLAPFGGGALTAECSNGLTVPGTATAVDANGNTISNLPVYYSSSDPDVATVGAYATSGVWHGSPFDFTIYPNCTGDKIGTPVWIRGTTTIYGVTYTDSVQFTATLPTIAGNSLYPGVLPDGTAGLVGLTENITIAKNGIVFWIFAGDTPGSIDIIFDKPDAIERLDTPFDIGGGLLVPGDVGGNIIGWTVDPTLQMYVPDADGFYVPNIEWGHTNARVRRFPVAGRYTYYSPGYPGIKGTVTVSNQ